MAHTMYGADPYQRLQQRLDRMVTGVQMPTLCSVHTANICSIALRPSTSATENALYEVIGSPPDPSLARTRGRRTGRRRSPRVTDPASVQCRVGPVRVVLAPRPTQHVHVGGHHLQTRAHGDGQQDLPHIAAISFIATLTTSGIPGTGASVDVLGMLLVARSFPVVLVRAVSFW